jgi:ATP-dependent HslUV protease, peptidase subunit HslV
LTRAAVELAKDWRTDRYLRRLEAIMIVADRQVSLMLTGTGEGLIETEHDAETIVKKALAIAAEICVYTNRNVSIETLKT